MPATATQIIAIGSMDLSNIALCGQVSFTISPLWGTQTFINALGDEVRDYLGYKINLDVSFEDVDSSTAGGILSACGTRSADITFINPAIQAGKQTATFEMQSVRSTVSRGNELDEWYDISITAEAKILSGSGL